MPVRMLILVSERPLSGVCGAKLSFLFTFPIRLLRGGQGSLRRHGGICRADGRGEPTVLRIKNIPVFAGRDILLKRFLRLFRDNLYVVYRQHAAGGALIQGAVLAR